MFAQINPQRPKKYVLNFPALLRTGIRKPKKNFRYFFWSFFYCTVVPTICNPLFRMFMAALRSRWWCVWQCGHSQFLMCKFCFPLIFFVSFLAFAAYLCGWVIFVYFYECYVFLFAFLF